ncbi:MAG: hypothetical protein RL094_238 [Candidatus Parcubacteria bacterium]|jgi:SAM-dependent methyltransferase
MPSSLRSTLRFIKKVIYFPLFLFIALDYIVYRNRDSKQRFSTNISDVFPQIFDKTRLTGFDRHYVYHTSWAARKVKEINPAFHVDISSSLYFCGIVSAFVPVHFYDYRPAPLYLSDLESKEGDLMKLPFQDSELASLSCMHTIEHIGLGRYGDPIDPEGDIKAINELKRVVRQGGSLLFVTPVGKPKIMFNAHRIYSYKQVLSYFPEFELREFSLVPEQEKDGGIITNATEAQSDNETYGCGLFWFVKK